MRILGVSAFYHDSAAALIEDGRIVAAAQEERFTRKKHDSAFPKNAIGFCLERAGVALADVDFVAFYDKPFLKFERLLETYVAFAPRGFSSFRMAMPVWLREKLFQKDLLRKKFAEFDPAFDWMSKLLFSEHHLSHAASAFFPSPFEEALVLTMDGVGEWATTSIGVGRDGEAETVTQGQTVAKSEGNLSGGAQFRINLNDLRFLRSVGIDPTRKVKAPKRLNGKTTSDEPEG